MCGPITNHDRIFVTLVDPDDGTPARTGAVAATTPRQQPPITLLWPRPSCRLLPNPPASLPNSRHAEKSEIPAVEAKGATGEVAGRSGFPSRCHLHEAVPVTCRPVSQSPAAGSA
jgi:hypothetical protein